MFCLYEDGFCLYEHGFCLYEDGFCLYEDVLSLGVLSQRMVFDSIIMGFVSEDVFVSKDVLSMQMFRL